jgi:hypothetical protein
MVSQTIQYSDGRTEIVDVPIMFRPGEWVAVTHKKNGSTIIQRVSPQEDGFVELLSACPVWEAGQSIRARAIFSLLSAWRPGVNGLEFSIVCDSGDPSIDTFIITNSDDLSTITTGDIIPDINATSVWVYVKVWIGAYSRMRTIEYSTDGGATWNYVMDGDLTACVFVDDKNNGWYKVPPGIGASYSLENEILFI